MAGNPARLSRRVAKHMYFADSTTRPPLDALKAAKLQLKSVKRAELRQMWEEWDRADPKVSA